MLHKEFFRYVIPSMIAFAFSGVYSIVDGWFIGNNIGEAGLAAINIAYPITALIQATGTGIGMGGAILISISRGKREPEAQREYLGITMGLLIGVGIVELIAMYAFYPNILHFFGASGEIMDLGSEYIRWIIYGTMFQIIGTGLVPIVRNYNGAVIAMISMVLGFAANVLLDWLFIAILGYGMFGAAAATVCGQGLAIVPSLGIPPQRKKVVRLYETGFGTEETQGSPASRGIALWPDLIAQYYFDHYQQECNYTWRSRSSGLLCGRLLCGIHRTDAAAGRGRRIPAADQPILRCRR